jgi:hypothetical protein
MNRWATLLCENGDMRGVLAQWVGDKLSCVDPYWLLAAAMEFAAFTRLARAPGHKLPVLVEKAGEAGQRFVLEAHSRDELVGLIRRVADGALTRFQLAAPRTAGITEDAELDGRRVAHKDKVRGAAS